MSPSQPEPTLPITEENGLASLIANILATQSLLVLIVLVSIVVVLRKGTKTSSELPMIEVEKELEVTLPKTPKSGGLLARATKKQ
jgi:hypothetical protein